MTVTVVRRKGEEDKQLLDRFRKKVANSGILKEARQKRWFTSKAEQRRLDKKRAVRRIQRKRRQRGRRT